MEYFKAYYLSPIGTMELLSNEKCLLKINFTDSSANETNDVLPKPLQQTIQWLEAYFSGLTPSPNDLPLHFTGTDFQKEIWKQLKSIPYGQTITYGQIAASIAEKRGISKMSAQAVGQAVGANPLPIIIPCHRVIGSNQKLIGYSCGIDRKKWLLDHERQK